MSLLWTIAKRRSLLSELNYKLKLLSVLSTFAHRLAVDLRALDLRVVQLTVQVLRREVALLELGGDRQVQVHVCLL